MVVAKSETTSPLLFYSAVFCSYLLWCLVERLPKDSAEVNWLRRLFAGVGLTLLCYDAGGIILRRFPAISALPKDAKYLIDRYIFSVSQLEVLILLYRSAERVWTAPEAARELYSNEEAVTDLLRSLERGGFIAESNHASAPGFRYDPREPVSPAAVDELVRAYSEKRMRVIDLIYNKPPESLRSFADAFKFKGEDE
jgi:hypothetical protein